MNEFWLFVSVIISLAGFLIVAATSLSQGEDLLWTVLKSLGAFVALWLVQRILRQLLSFTVGSESGQEDRNQG